MKKSLLLFLIFLPALTFAQWFIDASVGYTYPLFNNKYNTRFELSGIHVIQNSKYIKSETNLNKLNPAEGYYFKTNLGYKLKRFNFGIEFSYLDNSVLKNSLAHNMSENQYYTTSFSNSSIHTYTVNEIDLFFTKWINAMPNIGFNIKINRWYLIPKIGLSIDYILLYRDNYEINFTRRNNLNNDTINEIFVDETTFKFKYQPKISFSPVIGIATQYKLNNNITLFCELSYSHKILKIEKEIQYFYSSKGISNNFYYENTEEKEYQNEFSLYMNNLRSAFGIRYTFAKKED